MDFWLVVEVTDGFDKNKIQGIFMIMTQDIGLGCDTSIVDALYMIWYESNITSRNR